MKESLRRVQLALMVIFAVSAVTCAGCVQTPNDTGKKSVPSIGQNKGQQEVPVPSSAPITEEKIFFDFENDLAGWEIPAWSTQNSDYVTKTVEVSKDFASHGQSSMKIVSNFAGSAWQGGLVEIQQYLDLSAYRVISLDIYVPKGVPEGLKAKIILTVGENWKFVEMSRTVPLMPGQWTTITANIEPGSYDWKRVVPDEKFAADVRKIAIRIESNRTPVYSGPIYIDNIRCGK